MLCLIGSTSAQSCQPDPSIPDSIIVAPLPYTNENPELGIQDTACANGYFETLIFMNIPNTIVVFGNEVPLDSVSMASSGGISDLPASLSYACNPPNCVFEADSSGCIVIYGTPSEGEIGMYDLKVNVTIHAGGLMLDRALPDQVIVNGNYFFFVQAEGSPNCTIVSGIDEENPIAFSLYNQPNPFTDFTEIKLDSRVNGNFQLIVQDLVGKTYHRAPINLQEGQNTITFDGSQLANGMYIYTITDGKSSISEKMILSRR
ncbi:MAG: hypothetical protein DHS20C18_43060 [Saprospiraceae bacterium]|nr:MAG: hypothetical protein DHS20C18_43060 [Saprospiraceae bacterium]